ncbi:MAG: tyrosine-type recombinase/integrase [Coraliomargarita sp.]|nr:tyrosine-type recombinase/integrase [Coraliomargarita sp.]
MLAVIKDAPKAVRVSTGSISLREAREWRDRRAREDNIKWLSVMEAAEKGKQPPYRDWEDIQSGRVASKLTEIEREQLLDMLENQMDRLLGREKLGDEFYRHGFDSPHVERFISESKEAQQVVSELDRVNNRVGWLEAAEKRVEEDVALAKSSAETLLQSAKKFDAMKLARPCEITPLDARDFMLKLAREGRADSYMKRLQTNARMILTWTFPDNLERHNVFKGHRVRGAKSDPKIPFYPDDLERLFSTEAPNMVIDAYIRAGLYLGTRPSELLHGELDEEQMLFRVGEGEEGAKTEESVRKIPVHPEIVGYIKAVQASDTRLNTLQQTFRKWRNNAGLSKRLTLHSLRHSFTARLSSFRVERHRIEKLQGHKQSGDIHARYAHVRAQDLREEVEMLDWHEVVSNWAAK